MTDFHEYGGGLSAFAPGANQATDTTKPSPPAKPSRVKRARKAKRGTKPNSKSPSANLSAPADAGGHRRRDTHKETAACELHPGHFEVVTRWNDAGEGVGLKSREAQRSDADPQLIDAIREQWRRRVAWHRAEKSLTLQAKALCRRLVAGDKAEAEKVYKAAIGKGAHPLGDVALPAIWPLVEARDVLEGQRKAVEKELEKMAKRLPVWAWCADVRGVGPLLLAGIVGESGDIGSYKSVSALWKRMGLAVISGGRQRRVTGAEALDHGYSPERRSLMWNLGDCIVKAQVRKHPDDEEARIGIGELGTLYLERKAYEAERVETKAHAHNRAKRYVEKRFLRGLYSAWRGGQNMTEAQKVRAAPKLAA